MLVGVSNPEQHLFEFAAFLTGRRKLGQHWWEDSCLLKRRGQARALLNPKRDGFDRLVQDPVGQKLARDIKGLEQRHTALQ